MKCPPKVIYYLIVLIHSQSITGLSGQSTGDYRSAGSGNWDDPASWEVFDGNSWVTPSGFPDDPSCSAEVLSGHQIIYRESNAMIKHLVVHEGGKLYSAGSGSYWYLVVFGNICCDGTVGNQDSVDGLCLKPEGDSCLISGSGDCRFRRIRKDMDSVLYTRLIIGMNMEVYYDGTADAVYNNCSSTVLEIEIRPLCGLTLHASLDLQDASLYVLSDLSGNGSLICPDIQHADSSNVFLELFLSNNNNWHFIGSPVSGQALQPEFVPDPITNTFDFYSWDEEVHVDSGWINIRNTAGGLNLLFDTVFTQGKGYLCSYSSLYNGEETRTFSGSVTSGNFSIPLSYSSNHWNLLSNPYPCGLNWQSNGIDKSLVAGLALYIWDQDINGGIGGYRVSGLFVVPATNSMAPVVPPMNGFFVKSIGTGHIAICPDSSGTLVHPGIPVYKNSSPDSIDCLRIRILSGEYQDEIVVAMRDDASNGYDPMQDAEKMFRIHDSVPEIASLTAGNRTLCIDLFNEPPHIIPLYIISPGVHPLCISVSGQDHFDPGTGIFLIDSTAGTRTDLRSVPQYTFAAEKGIHDNRFFLSFEEGVQSDPLTEVAGTFDAYAFRDIIVIKNFQSIKRGVVTICDLLGRELMEVQLTGATLQRISAPFLPPVSIVNIRTGKYSYTKKVFSHY